MFFFGWGKRNITKVLTENEVLILNYAHFNIFFVFSVAFNYTYTLATKSAQGWHHKSITKEEAERLLAGAEFKPHWWWRYSLFIFPALVIAIIAIMSTISAITSVSY